MNNPIPLKTLLEVRDLLETLINGDTSIIVYQIDGLVRFYQSNATQSSSAVIRVNNSEVEYINKLAFSPAQIDIIESFAEDWRNGIVHNKHYDADESRQDKLFTEFYKHFRE